MILVVLCLPQTIALADDVASARLHYEQGTKAYDLGHYADAVKEYEAAYDAKPDPAILYNMGQAYRLAGDYPSAIRSYKSYLRRVPDAENRVEVEGRIADLQRIIDQQTSARRTVALPAAPTETVATPAATGALATAPNRREKPVTHKAWFWGIVGTAAVVVIGGVVTGVVLGTRDSTRTVPGVQF